jgi:hypothetical protein
VAALLSRSGGTTVWSVAVVVDLADTIIRV